MSSLVVSSKCVEISNNIGIVNIKNAKVNASPQAFPILYKVKTNLKDLVDVRPSFGVLWSQSQKSIQTLNIKYSGTLDQIEKAKLMITWFSTQEKKEYENRKFNHDEFKIFFNSAKKINEGTVLLPIVFKEHAEKARAQQNKSEFADSHPSQDSIHAKLESLPHQNIQQTNITKPSKDSQTKFQSVISPQKDEKSQKVVQKKVKTGTSFKVTLVAIIIAFVFGVSVGMKFERIIQPIIGQYFSVSAQKNVEEVQTPIIINEEINAHAQEEKPSTHQINEPKNQVPLKVQPQQIQNQEQDEVQPLQEVQL